jgi:penicillin-binding protein 1A
MWLHPHGGAPHGWSRIPGWRRYHPVYGHVADARLLQAYDRRYFRRTKLGLLVRGGWRLVQLCAVAAAGIFLYYSVTYPEPMAAGQKDRAPLIRVLARDGAVLAERGTPAEYLPLALVPKHVSDAVVATEDRRFFSHWGIDPWGLVRAALANVRAGRYAQGGSTITQQLAKNLFLTSDRTIGRKFEELLLAVWLEVRLTKPEILELYLNRVYFGSGAYGIEAASQRYFGKSVRRLDLAEAAVLAGLLKAPSRYAPTASPGAARARARAVLQKMVAAGLITPAEGEAAEGQIVRFAASRGGREATGLEYAIDFALERLPAAAGSEHREIIVETTIDAALQRRAQTALQDMLAKQGAQHDATQGAIVVLEPDGAIRAMVGGRSYAESQFNRAAKARRQPGSAFKPFVYLAALESGRTPSAIVQDMPLTVAGWSPRNEGGHFRGPVTLRQGLALSINTVAARLQQEVGAARVVAAARRLGVASELHEGPSLALGTSEVSLLELSGAYAAFANGGIAVEPHVIRRMRSSSGRVLYAAPAVASKPAIVGAHVGAMNDMLTAVVAEGTGRRAALPRHQVAGKTGTTQDNRDAWFIGYTAHLVAGVWVGNDDGRAMDKVQGSGLPAAIWREIMLPAHEGVQSRPLPGLEVSPDRSPPEREIANPPRASLTPPKPIARSPAAPAERIDEAFIERMLAEPALAPAVREASGPPAARLDYVPTGMMSLGARR